MVWFAPSQTKLQRVQQCRCLPLQVQSASASAGLPESAALASGPVTCTQRQKKSSAWTMPQNRPRYLRHPRPSIKSKTGEAVLHPQRHRNRHQSEVDTRSPQVMSDGRPRYLTPNIRALQESVAYLTAIVLEDFETCVPFQPF